ncbi:unnamed protein product [Rhizopus stolonifer]
MTLEDMTNSKNKRQQLSSFVRGQIVGMHMLNGKATQISSILNMPISTVKDVIRLYIQKGVEVPPKHSGRPKVFSDRTKFAIARSFRAAPFMPITTQHQHFITGGVKLSYTTFRRRMLNLEFSSYSPARKPALSDRHKRNRLHWCQNKVDWTVNQWKSIVWSDESRYRVVGNNGGFRVVCKEGLHHALGLFLVWWNWPISCFDRKNRPRRLCQLFVSEFSFLVRRTSQKNWKRLFVPRRQRPLPYWSICDLV